uniref:Fibronectin type-III domain-containing protein n=1 Tax=Esox lucius TaxID=8010 RepID=A0A6Q2ZNY7_ESOLU
MAEHPPPLESGQILSPDVPLLASPPPGMVNGDGPQQVILVQVNPGEAFTIRREDGQFQCITGPAQVPMMSPNGSVPPIYVPPGYVSQIIEENGVRRVLVLPQQPEFHPGGHSPLHHPPPPPHAHLPTFIPHHPMMPHPPHIYSSMAGGVGDMGSQYIPQYHPAHIYSEQDPHSPHGRPLPFAHRDERASKTYERLQKKLKDRQGGERGGQMKDSPPPSPQKSGSSPPSMDNVHNGVGGKGLEAEHGQTSRGPEATGRQGGEELSATLKDLRPATDYHVRVVAVCPCLQGSPSEPVAFTTLSCEPDPPSPPRKASGSKSSTLVLQWKAPCDNGSKIQNYILQWDEGKGTGVYEQCYYGPQKQYRVTKLSPASRYSFRLAAKNDMGVSEFSEVVDLYTSCSVPSPPLPPELVKAGVTWLCLTWQRPSASPKEDDIYYTLEMDDDEGYGFQPRYDGDERSCTVKNLHRSTKYKFRVAAYNTEGKSNPSQVAEFTTCPDRPGGPCRPVIKGRALPTSFRLAWEPPEDNGGAEVTKYVVEISEGLSGLSWELGYSGPALEHLCDGLLPGHSYQTRVYCMSEGGQSPLSETLQVQTPAVPPGQCQPPRVVGKPKAREVQLRWAPPGVDGGSPVSLYSVEVCGLGPQGSAGQEEFREVYQGSEVDCTVGNLLPGRIYGFRLRASNKAGFGPHSERSEVTTGPGAPEPCKAPHITCKSPTVAVVSWEVPVSNGAPVSEYRVEWGAAEGTMQVCYSGASLTHEVKGLLPATIYFCRVQVGPSLPPVCLSLPPVCLSLPPVCLSLPPVCLSLSPPVSVSLPPRLCLSPPPPSVCVRWEAPCDHGAEITTYIIDLGERQPISVGPVTKHIIQNLQPDTSYRYTHTSSSKTNPGTHTHPPPKPTQVHTHILHQNQPRYTHTHCSKTYQVHTHIQLQNQPRFVCLYRGPCHTHKVQRLSESTSYMFRVQAFNEAGQGLFSPAYTFTTPRSPPAPLKAPKVERVEDMPSVCEVSWELLLPMKGDPIIYTLQSMMGNSEYKQVYKGPASSCQVPGLQPNSEYRFRVCAVRQCQDAPELSGPYSPTVVLSPQRSELSAGSLSGAGPRAGADVARPIRTPLSDEQWAALILMLFAVISILIAFVIQYFVIK